MRRSSFSFYVCTYNSSKTLARCLSSIRELDPKAKLVVVDHYSDDSTLDVARRFGAEVFPEDRGLGHARQLCFELARSDYIVFVDSDVEVVDDEFLEKSSRLMSDERVGAVVGLAKGHLFAYGLPGSLLVLRRRDFRGTIIPDYIDARETFFIQKRLDGLKLRTAYVRDAIIHRSQFRKYKAEWEGANTRVLPSPALKELLFALEVVLLLSLNSRSIRNILYVPIFYARFVRGFVNPRPWLRLQRVQSAE